MCASLLGVSMGVTLVPPHGPLRESVSCLLLVGTHTRLVRLGPPWWPAVTLTSLQTRPLCAATFWGLGVWASPFPFWRETTEPVPTKYPKVFLRFSLPSVGSFFLHALRWNPAIGRWAKGHFEKDFTNKNSFNGVEAWLCGCFGGWGREGNCSDTKWNSRQNPACGKLFKWIPLVD